MNENQREKQVLTIGQLKFQGLLQGYPDIYALWDFDRAEYSPDMGQEYLATASHGERVLTKFLVGLWLHGNTFDFDVFDAVGVLGQRERQLISDWLADPFWP